MSNRDRSFRHVVLFACLLAVVVFPLRATVPASSPEQAFDALWHLAQSPVGMESDAQHAEAISTMYAELFPAATLSEDALKKRSDAELRYLFRASQMTSIYKADPAFVHHPAPPFAEKPRP